MCPEASLATRYKFVNSRAKFKVESKNQPNKLKDDLVNVVRLGRE